MQPPSSAAMIFASARGGRHRRPAAGGLRQAGDWLRRHSGVPPGGHHRLLHLHPLPSGSRRPGPGPPVFGASPPVHRHRGIGGPSGPDLGHSHRQFGAPAGASPPPKGVYACRARTPEGTYLAVTNIGTRPTVNGHGLTIEPWLLDYTGDLYGQPVTLELWHFLRGERRFPSLEALQDEIRRNAGQTRAFFEK